MENYLSQIVNKTFALDNTNHIHPYNENWPYSGNSHDLDPFGSDEKLIEEDKEARASESEGSIGGKDV